MTTGFLLAFPSSTGESAYICRPELFGEKATKSYPWMRATHRATAFLSLEAALTAKSELARSFVYEAPELNNNLAKRLSQSSVVTVMSGSTDLNLIVDWANFV